MPIRLNRCDFHYGDVAELADAKVSKTFEITSRVGSIPTIPTLFSGQWSVVSDQQAVGL